MIICADDYGLSPAVSAGIIELVEADRLSAVGCMMIGQDLEAAMRQLQLLEKRIETGLHLILTDDPPLTNLRPATGLSDSQGNLLSFGKLMRNAYRKAIDSEALSREIAAQLDRFTALMGHPPAFIDGHQHVQQLPVIRDAVAAVLQRLMANNPNAYVRVARLPKIWLMTKGVFHLRNSILGNYLIGFPGTATVRLMDQKNIPHNRFLLGYYDYRSVHRFADIFHSYLTLKPAERDLFFCHPGYADDELRRRDSVVDSRIDVLRFLMSSEYDEKLQQAGVTINSFAASFERL